MSGRFPGDNSYYTAHKCMITNLEEGVYEYVVGRALIDGTPDLEHTSNVATFKVYPKGIPIKVYHITD
jgi:hypothetical protein